MTIARRRAKAVLAAAALTGALVVAAPPAQAASCTTVPAGTPGTTLRLAGQDYRVPAISNVSVCTDGGSVPLVWFATSGGYCNIGCLSVGLSGGDTSTGAVTISYRADGSTVSHTINPGGVGGPGDSCLLSVGSPQAPHPTCPFAVNVDDLGGPGDPGDPGDPIGAVEQLVDDLVGDPPANCDDVPPQRDPWTGESVEFCDDPVRWATIVCERLCNEEEIVRIACLLADRVGVSCE